MFIFGNKKAKKQQEPETHDVKTANLDIAVQEFTAQLSEIPALQKQIEATTAAMDALFVRRFKKFHNVQDYLDFLKVMKFGDTYKNFHVDLDNGSIESIDAFCKYFLGSEFEEHYHPVSVMELNFKKSDSEEQPKEESEVQEEQPEVKNEEEPKVEPVQEVEPVEPENEEIDLNAPAEINFESVIIREEEENNER